MSYDQNGATFSAVYRHALCHRISRIMYQYGFDCHYHTIARKVSTCCNIQRISLKTLIRTCKMRNVSWPERFSENHVKLCFYLNEQLIMHGVKQTNKIADGIFWTITKIMHRKCICCKTHTHMHTCAHMHYMLMYAHMPAKIFCL